MNRAKGWHAYQPELPHELPRCAVISLTKSLMTWLPELREISMHSSKSALHASFTHSWSSSRYLISNVPTSILSLFATSFFNTVILPEHGNRNLTMSSLKLAFIVTVPECFIDTKLLGGAKKGWSAAGVKRFFKSLELPESSISILESGNCGS